MPAIKMTIKGIDAVQRKAKKRMKAELYAKAMHKAMEEGKTRAKDLCPVKTGFMRKQIHFKRTGKFSFRLTCDCKYASFNEFGWYGIPEVGTAEQPAHYKGGYRPFMRPGMILATNKMKKYISQVLVEGRFY
jgi:hypothetical protein